MAACILRLGVFFDGTGNGPDDDVSNILRLHDQYRTGNEVPIGSKKHKVFKLYIEGIGAGEGFISRKIDKGYGGGGGKKIAQAIEWVCAKLDANPIGSAPGQVRKREIDVFGFSRGAAQARDFVNTFIDTKINEDRENYGDVRFNFIGLYDTVASFGEPGNNVNMKPKAEYASVSWIDNINSGLNPLDSKEPLSEARGLGEEHKDDPKFEEYNFNLSSSQALRIVHMTAHDEQRINFPLHDTYGSGAVEYELMGVHSDVGGGYSDYSIENFTFERPYKDKASAMSDADKIAMRQNSEMGKYTILGGYSPTTKEVNLYSQFPTPHSEKRYYPALKKRARNDLAVVSLHLMYEEAKRTNVPLDKPKEEVPFHLHDYYEYAKVAKSKAWAYEANKEGSKIHKALKHHSSVGNDNYTGNTSYSDMLFDDSADNKMVGGNDINPEGRAIYTNKPKKAIVPK